MSEKIYAYLLRLFPSGFRRNFEAEALQLLRDRLADEKGFLMRFRLGFDLIIDILRALPQAYRNSYAEVTQETSTVIGVQTAPSFGILPREPLRPGALALAGLSALTVLSAFSFLMSRPLPYPPAGRKGPVSPIESVLERLNQPGPPKAIESSSSISAQGASPKLEKPMRLPASAAYEMLPPKTSIVSGARSRAELPGAKNQAKMKGPNPPREVSLDQSTGLPQQVVRRGPNSFDSTESVSYAQVVSLSGTWTVWNRPMIGVADVPRRFTFKQDNGQLTGSGGPDSSKQYPILGGLVVGDSVRLEISDGNRRFLYDLKLDGEGLKGTLSIPDTTVWRKGVWFTRVQPH